MIHCPYCQNQTEQDFGLVQCSQCTKNFFIHADGSVDKEPSESEVAKFNEEEESAKAKTETEFKVEAEEQEETLKEEEDSEDTADTEDTHEPVDLENLIASNGSDTEDQVSSKKEQQLISYTLILKGIDQAHLQAEVRSILLSLYSEIELKALFQKNFSQGTLVLNSLYPIQASRLLHQLKDLPLDFHWKQVHNAGD